jgi:hypothetical protein
MNGKFLNGNPAYAMIDDDEITDSSLWSSTRTFDAIEGGGSNPFDQDLNTNSNVTFNTISTFAIGIGENPTANLSIKSEIGQDAEIRLDTKDSQDTQIRFKNTGVDKWKIVTDAAQQTLVFKNRLDEDTLTLNQDGQRIVVGKSISNFTIPTTRGNIGQFLRITNAGSLNWQDETKTTLKSAFQNASSFSDNIITTSTTSATSGLFLQQGVGAQSAILKCANSDSDTTFIIDEDGIVCRGLTINTGDDFYILPPVRTEVPGAILTDLEANGVLTWQSKSFGFQAILSNPTETVLQQNTWTSISGTRNDNISEGFTTINNALRYDGSSTKVFKVDNNLSWATTDGKESTVSVAVFVNNSIQSFSEMQCLLDDKKDYPRNCSTTAVVELQKGDFIDVRVRNIDSDDPILVSWMNTTIIQIN